MPGYSTGGALVRFLSCCHATAAAASRAAPAAAAVGTLTLQPGRSVLISIQTPLSAAECKPQRLRRSALASSGMFSFACTAAAAAAAALAGILLPSCGHSTVRGSKVSPWSLRRGLQGRCRHRVLGCRCSHVAQGLLGCSMPLPRGPMLRCCCRRGCKAAGEQERHRSEL